jgi:hypothetical protein
VGALAKAALAADSAALGWVAVPVAVAVAGAGAGAGAGAPTTAPASGKSKGAKRKGAKGAAKGAGGNDDDDELVWGGARASSASPPPPPPLPSCTTSWSVLYAGWDAAEVQRLGRVAVANVLALSTLGKDVEGVLREMPPPPPQAPGGAGAAAPGATAAADAVNMLDTRVLAWRQRWADAGAALQLGTQYDATYVAVRLLAGGRGVPA